MERALQQYLSDHWAGSKAGLSLARRALRAESTGAVALFLSRFIQEAEQDRDVLGEVMTVKGTTGPLKATVAWLGERTAALADVAARLAGRIAGLNHVMELESLMMATQGRIALWQTLSELQKTDPALQRFDFSGLLERAKLHREELERHRLLLAARVFKPTAMVPAQRREEAPV